MALYGPQAALNISIGLLGGSGTSAPHLTKAETTPATRPINAAKANFGLVAKFDIFLLVKFEAFYFYFLYDKVNHYYNL